MDDLNDELMKAADILLDGWGEREPEEFDDTRISALPSEEEECPHDEHDHGICLECGKDIFDDLVGEADFRRDAARDAWADRQGQ